MWYSSGTVSVTNGSGTVTGSGTAFLANARIGDGIVIEGSTAMHEVIGIASDTSLTIRPAYAGTSGSGRQYATVPVLGYDKDLSDAFNQIRLQFGDTLSALKPWAYAATANAALIELGFSSVGRSVATGTAAQGRGALGLGTAATSDSVVGPFDSTTDRTLIVGSFGLGYGARNENLGTILSFRQPGFYSSLPGNGGQPPGSQTNGSHIITASYADGSAHCAQIFLNRTSHRAWFIYKNNGAWASSWAEFYHTENTTVDSNGFLKASSPIIKLHADRIESNSEDAPAFERIGTGHYQLTGCNGLRLDDGWYIETPHDRNKNPYFNVEWEQDIEPEADAGVLEEPADVTLTIRCYERVWNPATGTHDNGDPVDIPDGRWIDLRLNEVRQPEPEIEEPDAQPELPPVPEEPAIPTVVSMAQTKLALLYADLYAPVEGFIDGLPEPQKTAALIEWNHRQTLERDHPLVAQAAAELGLTDQLLDELFMDAARR